NGNTISMSNANSLTTYIYDARSRETKETWTIGGNSYTVTYNYDSVGNTVGMTYPDGTSVKFGIDALNRVSSAVTGSTTLATITYGSNNGVKSITYGNGVQIGRAHV